MFGNSGVSATMHIPCVVSQLCNHTDAGLIVIPWANRPRLNASKAHHGLRSAYHTLENLPTVVRPHACSRQAMLHSNSYGWNGSMRFAIALLCWDSCWCSSS
jgi:hypothetical protein